MAPVAMAEEELSSLSHQKQPSPTPTPIIESEEHVPFTYEPTSRISKLIGTSDGLKPSLAQPTPQHSTAAIIYGPGLSQTTPLAASISATSTASSRALPNDPLPELPAWVAHAAAAWLAFGVVAAILLYFVNFPPQWLRSDKPRREHPVKKREDFSKHNDELELDILDHPRTTQPAAQGISTSADSPALDHGEWRPGLRRRAHIRNLSIDTSATYKGLGIAVPGIDVTNHAPSPVLHARKSWNSLNSSSSRSDTSSGVGASSHGSTSPLKLKESWQALDAPKPAKKHFFHSTRVADVRDAVRSLRYRLPDDEEIGLLKPTDRTSMCHGYRTPWPSPNGSPTGSGSSTPKSSSSRVRIALEKVGDGIEWGADKFAKMLHDQVKDDYEDGLLLPIRNEERGRRLS